MIKLIAATATASDRLQAHDVNMGTQDCQRLLEHLG